MPKYERPYDNNNLGNEKRLPRGRMTLEKNSDFYKSVHLTGAGLINEQLEQLEKEEKLWKSKVVVDSLDFKVGGYNTRDKPLQTAKIEDILKGPAMKVSLKMVRNCKLPSGPTHAFTLLLFQCVILFFFLLYLYYIVLVFFYSPPSNATFPTIGKKVPLRPPPISAFSGEEYSDPRDFTADLRPGQPYYILIYLVTLYLV